MGGVIVYTFLAGLVFYVARTWLRWSKSGTKWPDPQWRSIVATLGFVASSSSLLLIVGLAVHAIITGGFPYYSAPLMFAFRIGFLTSFAGIIGAVLGKGPLEIPTIISSLLCLLIWLMEAFAQ
jgi:hypothetical protein